MRKIDMIRFTIIAALILLVGCKPEPAVEVTETQAISSSDIVGVWEVLYVSGTDHPMVGGTLELTSDRKMITTLKSGKKHDDGAPVFWHLLRMETGEPIFARDPSFAPDRDYAPALDIIEMPSAVILSGDEMSWNALTRDSLAPVKPSGRALFKFRRKE